MSNWLEQWPNAQEMPTRRQRRAATARQEQMDAVAHRTALSVHGAQGQGVVVAAQEHLLYALQQMRMSHNNSLGGAREMAEPLHDPLTNLINRQIQVDYAQQSGMVLNGLAMRWTVGY